MKLCTEALNVKKVSNYYSIQTNCIEIRLYCLTDNIIRIRAGFDGDFKEASYSLVTTAWEDQMDDFLKEYRTRIECASSEMEDLADQTVITTRSLKVVIEKSPFRICIYDNEGTLLHADIIDLGYQEDSNYRRIHTSEITNDDCFYGFGEKTGELNKAMQRMSMAPNDCFMFDPKNQDSLYKHIPFYIKLSKETKKAVGYYYHTTFECDFDMGKAKSNYWHKSSRCRIDGGDIDLFFIAGPSMSDVIERYTDLTGKSVLLPKYALGYMGSSMYYPELPKDADDAVIDFIDTVKEEKIPMDGFQLSSGYCNIETEEGTKRCVFNWNYDRFKDPADFFKQMNDRGVPVSPNIKPGFLLVNPKLKEMQEKGMFIKASDSDDPAVGRWWGGKGYFVDFTNPNVRETWKQMITEYIFDYGTSCIWNDNCEYDSIPDKDARCDHEGLGGTVGQLKPVMSTLMCHVSDEAISEKFPGTRPYVICRSGNAGIQRYAQTWVGDNYTSWDSLKYNIATVLGMGLSGVANHGAEIGGFAGECPDKEILLRWVQHGIFQPRFSIHSANTDNTVTEPWMYSDITDDIRSAIEFRYQLSPYFYSLVYRAHKKGLPIVEAMVYAFQHDLACYDESVDFMLGDSLLVATVIEQGASTRKVYFPKNETFYDFYTREKYEGGQTVEFPVTMQSIPLFIRGGGIVPMSGTKLYNLMKEAVTDLHLICAPDKDGSFTLYEDDGLTTNYEDGDYLETNISMKAGEHVYLDFENKGSYDSKIETITLDVINRESSPFYVKIDDREITHFLNRKKFEAADEGWYYSPNLRSVLIKYKNPEKDYSVDISFWNYDLIGM